MRAGAGPTLLLLHGIGSSATSWQRQFDRLAGDYTLIAPDLRGYGDSPDPAGPPSLDAVADDLAALLDREPAHVVGVSFGALAALALARRHPNLVRSLVLSDTTLGRNTLAPDEMPAESVSTPGHLEKTCSAVGLRRRFALQTNRTFISSSIATLRQRGRRVD